MRTRSSLFGGVVGCAALLGVAFSAQADQLPGMGQLIPDRFFWAREGEGGK